VAAGDSNVGIGPTPVLDAEQIEAVRIGVAISSTEVMVWPAPVQYLKRVTLDDAAQSTITHYADAFHQRKTAAYVSQASVLLVDNTGSTDSQATLRRLEITDACQGGTASAGSNVNGDVPAHAFDDDLTTLWEASPVPEWISYDFGSGNDEAIQWVSITARRNFPERAPSDFTIEASTDNSTWNVIHTVTGETGWQDTETRQYSFSNSTAYRYWRINVSAVVDADYLNITDIAMSETAPTTDPIDKLAEQIELDTSATVQEVRLWLQKAGNPNGLLTLRIETDNSGEPSGTLVDSSAHAVANEIDLPTSYDAVSFMLAAPIALSDSTPYWLVLSTDRYANADSYVQWAAFTADPPDVPSSLSSQSDATWQDESKAAEYQLYSPGLPNQPCTLGRWAGGTRDLAVRHDNGTGTSLDSATTFKNTSGEALEVILLVELE